MKNVFIKLPVYTGDVSGAASALYELGGMSVIHDPSGCNSTYNTHDEIRWYSKESLIFISGLSEVDAITGNDNKFIKDVLNAAEKLKPAFIALFNSPIPYINGTDFKGIAKIIENKSGIPCFHIETNAMHDYSVGISNAFYEYARKFLPDEKRDKVSEDKDQKKKVNIIGMTPLDYSSKNTYLTLKNKMEKEGFKIISIWAEGSSREEILAASEADISLVISSSGIRVGEFLREKYGIPYLTGVPTGLFAKKIFEKLDNFEFCSSEKLFLSDNKYRAETLVVGESVLSLSLAAEYELETGKKADVISTTELGNEYLRDSDKAIRVEKELMEEFKNYQMIIADPLYRRIAPSTAKFIDIPHLAFSGRLYLKGIPDFFSESFSVVDL
ncbi:nitrogenase component 1 [Lachnospiraceae bacterium C1.1]|nr:nitrogenase component 1 [Lachnospiraceae bacterium C1.1]